MKKRYITYGDETKSMSEWARVLGMNRQTLWQRFAMGWTVEKAIGAPYMIQNMMQGLIKEVHAGKFGTKNRAELLLRLQDIFTQIKK